MDYKAAGVDVEAGYRAVELMRKSVEATFRKEVVGGLGGFGGMFSIAKAKDMDDPILVSGTDSVGTKIKIAFITDRHDTVGIDCVAMCVNDIVCCGAEPLFFLDYIGGAKTVPEKIAAIVKGVSDGCVMAGCSLVGGETAEMPSLYQEGEYDLVGAAVGIVDRKNIIDGSDMREGDVIIGLGSSGLHSNGFSLVRSVLRPSEANINEPVAKLDKTLGEELLTPTRIYAKPMLELFRQVKVKGVANITGGGFIENIPRMMGKGLKPVIRLGTWPVHPIFELLQSTGQTSAREMYNTYNMGIGMVFAVAPEDAARAAALMESLGERAYVIGAAEAGEGIDLCLE